MQTKQKLCLFQITLGIHSEEARINRFKSLDGAAIEFNEKGCLIQTRDSHQKTLYNLTQERTDVYTRSRNGELDEFSFRLVEPIGFSLEILKATEKVNGMISFGSMNPDDCSIHFYLVDFHDDRRFNVQYMGGKSEQVDKLVQACITSLENHLDKTFIEMSKRLINILSHDLTALEGSEKGAIIIETMLNNAFTYSIEDRQIIARLIK